MPIDYATRRLINEEEVKRYFDSWDPTWRWVLILGMRDMRTNLARLGDLAATEVGNDAWSEESYVYGPLALGITAAAVNEAAQHCEDLFALLSVLRDPTAFARRIGSYSAGKVVAVAAKIKSDTDTQIAARFCVPSIDAIEAGMAKAESPEAELVVARDGMARLGDLMRKVVDFYETYEFFHLQYKHGLKLLFRPFGGPPPSETIAERKNNVSAPLIALSNEALSKTGQKPVSQQAIMIVAGPEVQQHLGDLVLSRDVLRIQMAGPPVDLDEIVALSWHVSRLMRLGAANRQALGKLDGDGQQTFQLPGQQDRETISLTIEPDRAIELDDVS
jgi:hypothetical protein